MVLLRKAVEISCQGQNEVMKAVHPNMSELEIQVKQCCDINECRCGLGLGIGNLRPTLKTFITDSVGKVSEAVY